MFIILIKYSNKYLRFNSVIAGFAKNATISNMQLKLSKPPVAFILHGRLNIR